MIEQAPRYQTFWIIRHYLYWPKFLQVIFCYCSYTRATQLSKGYFIRIGTSSVGSGLSGPFSVFCGIFIAEEVDGAGDKVSRGTTEADVQTLLEAVLNMFLASECLMKLPVW